MSITATVVGQGQPGGDTQSDPIESFSFSSSTSDAALAMLNNDTPAATPEQVAQPQSPAQPETPAAEPAATNVETASASKLAQLADTDLVEVTVDGQPVTMPWAEAKGGVMRQAKFTKEMQAFRAQELQFNEQRAGLESARAEREALVSVLKDREAFKQLVAKMYPDLLAAASAEAPAQVDPEDIATVGQLQTYNRQAREQLADVVSQVERRLTEGLAKVTTEIEDRQATAKLSTEINDTIATLFNEHPHMKRIVPAAEQMLRWQVSQLHPKTPQETLEAFKSVFSGWVEEHKAVVAELTKSTVLSKQKLEQNNIQPSGGASVQPVPTSYKKKDGSVDWDGLRGLAESMLS